MDDRTLVKLINENKGLMYQIINKYKTYYDKDDLYQSTVIGIIKAYNNYDSTRDVKFSTYAYKYMLSEVISFIKSSKLIKTSRDYDKIYKKVFRKKNTTNVCLYIYHTYIYIIIIRDKLDPTNWI